MKLPTTLSHANFADYHAKKNSLTPNTDITGPLAYFLLMAALGALTMLCSALWTIFRDAPYVLVAGGILFAVIYLFVHWSGRQSRLKAEAEAIAINSGEVTLDESGICWRYETGAETELEWAGIASWAHTDRTIIFRHTLGTDLLIAIPADELMAFVESQVPATAPKIPAPVTAMK